MHYPVPKTPASNKTSLTRFVTFAILNGMPDPIQCDTSSMAAPDLFLPPHGWLNSNEFIEQKTRFWRHSMPSQAAANQNGATLNPHNGPNLEDPFQYIQYLSGNLRRKVGLITASARRINVDVGHPSYELGMRYEPFAFFSKEGQCMFVAEDFPQAHLWIRGQRIRLQIEASAMMLNRRLTCDRSARL